MTARRLVTENPVRTQWRLLSRYTYRANIDRYRTERGEKPVEAEVAEFVAGCLRQAEAYFNATAEAPLDISPLLLYYGTSNLLAGTCALVTGATPVIKNHGMKLQPPGPQNGGVGDYVIRPVNPQDGALQVCCDVFSPGCVLANGHDWSVFEVLASIPDLHQNVVESYPDRNVFTVPIEVVRKPDLIFDRISVADVDSLPDGVDSVKAVAGYSRAYLVPQITRDYVVLYRKPQAEAVTVRSIAGDTYLEIPHKKGEKLLEPGQLIAMFMSLYATGTLSRYYPAVWHPFVRTDATGERLILEHLLDVSRRYIPNLVLNRIEGEEVQFSATNHDPMDQPVPMSQRQVMAVAEEVVEQFTRRRELGP